jgi:hypothetical protein
LARHFPLPSFLSTKRSRMITLATAGTVTVATAISLAATLPAGSSPVPASADAAYTTTIGQQAAAQSASDGVGQAVMFARMRSIQGERQQQLAAEKAAARKAAVTTPSGSPEQIAEKMLSQFGWSSSQFSCLQPLWEHESGWSVTAENPTSGAYGIPQSLPASQMSSAGADWQANAATQIRWGLTYIQSRYGSPCGAWSHEESDNWY